ncbi:hypothetical protein BKA70DRAFT_1556889 [Coprinopsis sp. MPI-PUGE-AT-0042]|nr:hypothetical protein BKA70DRAFT_1556889 [Coprinopsis sp. MPI-PUGE-AT-0042]
MSFLKKIGGKRSKHGGEVSAVSSDVQEDAQNKAIREAEGGGVKSSEDTQRAAALQSDTILGDGSTTNTTPGQTVNISGGTFTEIQNQINNVQYITGDENDVKLFAMLSPVAAAHDCQEVTSKVTECFAGTRRQLLSDIEKWRTTDSSAPIFILDGIAGIGKTTVVKTVCAHAAAERRLAASWFFSRDQQDRKSTRSFVGTLAFQLASYHPSLRDQIAQALKDHPDILQKTIRTQFDTLIHEPLQVVLSELRGTHDISIDAIDECDLDEAIEILSILLVTVPKHPQLRVLITCRPERPFRLLLQKHRGTRVFHLHEIENSVVESDIRLYINHRLSPEKVDEALPDLLPPPWRASEKEREALVQMAGKLFIVASTAVNFILDPRRLSPAKQLRQLLDATGSGLASSPMDRLYTQVLRAAVPDPVDDWFDDYQAVVGAIVVAADVLPIHSLALLLDTEPNEIVRTLSHLHSLIAPTNHNEAFRVHHKSFPDFITDPSRCSIDSRFFIDASASHLHLATGCLRVMSQMLKQNICDLPLSDWSKELSELPPGTMDRIPPELAYACSHWIPHFQQGLSHFNSEDAALVDQLTAFVDQHLLSWLEVVALIGRFDTAWNSVDVLSQVILSMRPLTTSEMISQNLSHVVDVLKDFLRFITLHPNLPQLCPMHIYLSSLPFAPSASMMSKLYARCLPNESARVISRIDPDWDPIAVVFKGVFSTTDMRMSPCGATVAVLADTLRLYNVKSGAHIREFIGYPSLISQYSRGHIAFSPDGHLIAMGIKTGVYIWNVASGELLAEFSIAPMSIQTFDASEAAEEEHEDEDKDKESWVPWVPWVTSIAFTVDGASIVAGAVEGTSFFWKIDGGSSRQFLHSVGSSEGVCRCPPSRFLLVSWYPPDGLPPACSVHTVEDIISLPTSLSFILVRGNSVQFWDLAPSKLLATIPRHAHEARGCPTSLSLDKAMLAIESIPCAINIYSTSQPRCIAVLSGHEGLITAMAFATEHEELCSASQDMTVRIWHISTSTQLRIISTAPSILTDAFFAKSIGRYIFRNDDRMVMLADDKCTAFGPVVQRDNPWNSVRLSSDASTVAIFSSPFTGFSSLSYLIDTPSFDLSSNAWYRAKFSPTGDLVIVWNRRLGFLEVVISDLNRDGIVLASTSFQIPGIEAEASFVTSSDMARVAVTGPSSGVAVYNLNPQRLEAFLQLPTSAQSWVHFSWDSRTVYVEHDIDGPSHSFYAATVPRSMSMRQASDQETPPVITFSKYTHAPDPPWVHLGFSTLRPPPDQQLHFLSGHRAWFLQHPHGLTYTEPSSLPSCIDGMAYSPNGSLVAVIGRSNDNSAAPSVVQLRSLPDYNLIAALGGHQHAHGTAIQFIPSLPHILVAHSPLGITSWDTTTLKTLGRIDFSGPSIILSAHPYNASDFLCLIFKEALESAVGLAAIRLCGALPAKVCNICWFPPHLSVEYRWLEVNPCHPHIILVKGGRQPLLMDISKFPLPFTL